MAEERRGSWFGFGFCGFGQALGSGRGRQVHSPEPLQTPGEGEGADVCRVSASWSYTAFVTRGGRLELSGSAGCAAGGCRDAWASEALLVVLRAGPGRGSGTELQAWAPGSALSGEPLWAHTVGPEAEGEDAPGGEPQAGALPLLPGGRAYVSPRPPFYSPLAPELRARRLELGAEHALLLDEAGQVFSWGQGRHGQLGHGTLEAELEPRPLEALQGVPMAEVAAGGWHSVCVSETGDIYIWGWNESGQLALPSRSLAEVGNTAAGEASGLKEDGCDVRTAEDAVKASCGSRHTAVVTRTGELYTWGWGKYGQLGHRDTSSLDRPRRVEYFVDKRLQSFLFSADQSNQKVIWPGRKKKQYIFLKGKYTHFNLFLRIYLYFKNRTCIRLSSMADTDQIHAGEF
ncbi:RCC1 domain-containing protein 1 isoform X2 [Leopardus geoffroyi]|uniref:RCC1 domain-containing protein 1 isoform X2 n=1 Tax=Leopardus geoffroyi TaxID=46844 RepID=UPI001E263C5D|nr:RCC1 domain-containing protein 1 isoform X2 [Leopardus geoffroyi]